MKRNIVAVALAVVFVLALAAPAFAITHTATYEMDGVIDFKKQAGHPSNTGGDLKQTIQGSGEMSKVMTVSAGWWRLVVDDVNDWVAGETALTVTSVIELCAPPKYVYEGTDIWGNTATMPVGTTAIFGAERQPGSFGRGDGTAAGTTHYQLANEFGWDALTHQIWAVQVQADPGFSGNLHQDFTAAHGPYAGNGWAGSFARDYDDWYDDDIASAWAWVDNAWDNPRRTPGPDYVGSYFDINQTARTSMGTVKRFIDISSPVDHGYLMEDMSVVGKSEITESFNMTQIAPGADVPGLWWDLF